MNPHTVDTCDVPTHDHFGQVEAAQNVGAPIACKHCGNEVEQTADPTGQRTDAWAEKSWGDDRDFQCGLNPESNRHEPDDELVCAGVMPAEGPGWMDCARRMYYDYADESYHHLERQGLPCSLIPAEINGEFQPSPLRG